MTFHQVKLPGNAGEVQARCTLDGPHAAPWIQAVANGVFCDSSSDKEAIWLFKSAKEQCGAWCLWDL